MEQHVSGLPIGQMKEDAGKIYDQFKKKIDEGESVDSLSSDVACHCLALIDYIEKELLSGRTLTCVYCGQEYPQGTPTWGSKILTDHIKVCKKHPLRKAEETIVKLRKALTAMIRDDGKVIMKDALQVLMETENWDKEIE